MISVISMLAVFSIVYTECSVIRVHGIPLEGNVTTDILVMKDAEGNPIAKITIGMEKDQKNNDDLPLEHTKRDKDASTKLIDQFIKATGDIIPNFERKFGFGVAGSNCPRGKVRRGPICVYG
ncbi:jg7056 [Pararge aegeria aegeria]|uniref:Jg7056 protein n=1 Tax=Pararge aegeria aegeria TaxID=348720 RepID=A0A8S4RI59_9NEOP|nr:jg7056 [Pararge aegeria aegeria]